MPKTSSVSTPNQAVVLAAGLGKRMHPITLETPKPLVRVHGKALIDHGIDALARAGVTKVVVNVHHLADRLENHLAACKEPEIVISDEREELLDSGGGAAKATGLLDPSPFYLLNGDSFWIEGYRPNLLRMAEQWDPVRMDFLMLVANMCNAIGYDGPGDVSMEADGRLSWRKERHVSPFAYAGAAIVRPELFRDVPQGPFSLKLLFDRACEAGRLYGVRLDGLWLHVGTPEAITDAEAAIARSAA